MQRTPAINNKPTEQTIKSGLWELLRAEIEMYRTEMYRERVEWIEVAEDVTEWYTDVSTQRVLLLSSAGVTPTSEVRVAFMLLTHCGRVT